MNTQLDGSSIDHSNFDQNTAATLAHSYCAAIATKMGARVLSIKGPVANQHRIRVAHYSADADVLIEPGRVDEFAHHLETLGWRKWVGRETPSLLPLHAHTYTHPEWPCAIDVHDRYPGFFAPPEEVFERLWSTRCQLLIGHYRVAALSLAASAIVAAMHAARHPSSARHRREMQQVERLWSIGLTPDDRAELLETARVGRALWVVRDIFTMDGASDLQNDLTADEMRRWNLYRELEQGASALGWFYAITRAPIRSRIRLVVAAIWVPRKETPRQDPLRIVSWTEALSYNYARWIRGITLMCRFAKRSGYRP